MYSKCGHLGDALRAFDEMPERNLVSWTLMVAAAVQDGEFELGLEIYSELVAIGLRPNEFTVGSVLKGCATCASIEAYKFGMSVHSFSLKIGIEQNRFVGSSILNMYAKLEDVESAKGVFESMTYLDTACWNTMIGGYAQCGYGFESLKLVSLMVSKGISMDHFTFVNALKGCSSMGNLDLGKQLHGLLIQSDMEFSTSVMNALTDMYSTNGKKDLSFKVFNRIKTKDIISWNTAFGVFSEDINARELLNLVHEFMLANMKPNHITFSVLFRQCGQLLDLNLGLQFYCLALQSGFCNAANVRSSLINMFSRCGAMEMAHLFFDSLLYKNITSWNELIFWIGCGTWGTMISALVHQGYLSLAIKFLNSLIEAGGKPDEFILGSILNSCAGIAVYHLTKSVHSIVIKMGFQTQVFVVSAVLDAYAKCGDIESARMIFSQSFRSGDVVICNAMIIACAHHGLVEEAMDIFEKMKLTNLKPSQATFVSALAAVVTWVGLIMVVFCFIQWPLIKRWNQFLGIFYGCMVDMLSRNGFLEESRQIIEVMPYTPWPAILRSLLSGCRIHGNLELGEWTVKELVQLVPEMMHLMYYWQRLILKLVVWKMRQG
ncbi:hypothetical protein M0R45_008637 [Rubus argutus]